MNQPATTRSSTAFTPSPDDMCATAYGLHVSCLGEDGDEGYIAIGPGADNPRRALAAITAHMRDTGELDQLRDQLAGDDGMRIAVTPTAFTRTTDDGPCPWTATPNSPGAPAAAWLIDPWDPATRPA